MTRSAAAGLLLAASVTAPAGAETEVSAILTTYADIAHAGYEDSLVSAEAMQAAIEDFLAEPSAEGLEAARAAWRAARVPYMQTEAYRFGNAVVDDWEGKVNAWPLDEGLLDYVAASYGDASEENPVYAANLIGTTSIKLGTDTIDTGTITAALLEELHELGGVEANVSTGYHAVEFMLWGQDLKGTGAGAGERAWTDFAQGEACTGGNCARRAAFLATVTDLLVHDLSWMAGQWAEDGEARAALLEGDPDTGLSTILTGLGSLSYGELAGERMKLGLLLHDPEEEHDCFADNTHMSHYYDVIGMLNVYTGTYTRIDGRKVAGLALAHLVAEKAPAVNAELLAKLAATEAAMGALRARAETVEAYDQMIGPDNPEGNAVVQAAIDALTDQTRAIETVVSTLGLQPIEIEGSDSLDDPEAVFQ